MKIFRFNMIEIVLAIGIAAFGVTAVVALIPPALNANRDVSSDSFVDEANTKIKFLVDEFYVPQWGSRINDDTYCPSSYSTISELNKKTKGDNIFKATPEKPYSDELRSWNIFTTSEKNVFVLSSSDSSTNVHAVVWKQPVQPIPNLNPPDPANYVTPAYSDAAQIFVEISWPVNLAHSQRQKRIISFEVYR